MANEKRSRTNLVAGALSSALTTGATSMASAGLADLGVIDSTNHAAVTLFVTDADGRVTAKEIVYVTAHTASATSATIVRGREGTADPGTTWAIGTKWAHTATALDLNAAGVITATSNTVVTAAEGTSSTTYVGLTTADTLTVVVGPSGVLMVWFVAEMQSTAGSAVLAAVALSGTNTLAASDATGWVIRNSASNNTYTNLRTFAGLTPGPGTVITIKWRVSGGSAAGGTNRQITALTY